VLKEAADAAFNSGAHVLYIGAEGGHGIMTARLPVLCRQRGRSIEGLDDRWRTISVAPGLLSVADINDLIEEYREFRPDIIVLDTVTRAVPGADINSPAVGIAIITGMEALAGAFSAAVIAITHPGKDASKGGIGSSLIESLAYAIWRVLLNDGIVKLRVEKMKDGVAEFTIPFRYTQGVPVVVEIPPGEQVAAMAHGNDDPKMREQVEFKRSVLGALRDMWVPGGSALTVHVVAIEMSKGGEIDQIGNTVSSTKRRLQRSIKGGAIADLVVCDTRGVPLSEPYTFKPWAEVEAIARCLGMLDEATDEDDLSY
jgi:hypothetical protein